MSAGTCVEYWTCILANGLGILWFLLMKVMEKLLYCLALSLSIAVALNAG